MPANFGIGTLAGASRSAARPTDLRNQSLMPPAVPAGRDLRLDLFRGLALWLIYLDHIPSNMVSWLTIRNYGFSDATEIFVFISGYTAAFVYGREMQNRGVVVSSARILKRTWQLYVAHIFLFVIYMAEISYVAASFDNPLYSEEMGILNFLKQPDVTMIQAMLLKFKPANMDVLPLYIILLAGLPPMLWLLLRNATLALAASVTLYVLTWWFDLNFPAYPNGGVQSDGVAAVVRVRRLVRARRRGAHRQGGAIAAGVLDRGGVSRVRVPDHDDVVLPAPRRLRA
jgi:hypothetical protein